MPLIHNENICTFRLKSSEVKVFSYADNVAVFLYQSRLCEVVRPASSRCQKTGSVINWNKRVDFWQGSWTTAPKLIYFERTVDDFAAKYLGVLLRA